jgi:hypothetical protein
MLPSEYSILLEWEEEMNVSPFPKIHLIPEDKELKDGQ